MIDADINRLRRVRMREVITLSNTHFLFLSLKLTVAPLCIEEAGSAG